jgi:penicillin-binding protein 2
MVTGFGALASGLLDPKERIDDMGYYTKYNKDEKTAPKCWISKAQRSDHQDQTIKEGIKNSCNYFFYTIADRLGEQRLYTYATLFGLTSTTGIDLPGEVRPVVGCQRSLYDPNKPVNEANQDTSLPIIVFNQLKAHLANMGNSRNLHYEDERLSVCVKRLMDMAEQKDQGDKGELWLDDIRTILMEELNMSREMVYSQLVIGDTYRLLNDIKWGGGQTILTGIGQSVTVLTPLSVARYVAAVANGGKVYNVSLIDSITSPTGEILAEREPSLQWTLEKAEKYMPYIHKGMKGVTDDTGTAARYFKNWPYEEQIAAKTGTAQVTHIDVEDNAWFVCFAPLDNPEIAVVCFIPSGASGGYASQAPRDFIEWYMKQKELRSTDIVLPLGNSLAP